MMTYEIALTNGITLTRHSGSLAAIVRYAKRVFGNNLKAVSQIVFAQAA